MVDLFQEQAVGSYAINVRCLFRRWLLLIVVGAAPAIANRIGDIEFFGYKGLDVAKIRRTMPVHEGDEYSDRTKNEVRQAVAAMIGKEPTDVAAICCDEKGTPFSSLASQAHQTRALSTMQNLKAMNAFPRRSWGFPAGLITHLRRLYAGAVRLRRRTTPMVTRS